jgi:hypothetical protein
MPWPATPAESQYIKNFTMRVARDKAAFFWVSHSLCTECRAAVASFNAWSDACWSRRSEAVIDVSAALLSWL